MTVVAMVVAPAVDASAQVDSCQPNIYTARLAANEAVTPPAGFTRVSIGTTSGTPLAGFDLGVVGTAWTAPQIEVLRTARQAGAALIWDDGAGRRCRQAYPSIATAAPGSGTTSTGRAEPAGFFTTKYPGPDSCQEAGASWLARLRAQDRGPHTVVVFQEDLGVCYQSTQRPTQGDPIHVGVFTEAPDEWDGVRAQFQPCALEPSAPSVLANGTLGEIKTLVQSAEWILRPYPPRSCWNTAVVISVQGGDKQISHTLAQANRYRATVHLGVIFTENHEVTFGLRPEGGVNKVYEQGPTDKGPEYVGALVIYGLPHYVKTLFGGSYPGRDPVKDTGLLDRIGGVIGLGLTDPTERFVAGFTFEVAAGINLMFVRDFVESTELAGIKPGDPFAGTAEQIPTMKQWRNDKWVWGISMDLVYAAAAFKR